MTANDVHYYLTKLRLNPHETRMIDLRQLRDAQVPDYKNNLIPAQATDGSVNWIRIDNVAVMGRLMVINRGAGMASNYDCCTGFCPGTLIPGSMDFTPASATVAVADGQQYHATVTYMEPNLVEDPIDQTDWGVWSSQYTDVATVNDTAMATGVAGGTSTISIAVNGCSQYITYYYGGACYCYTPATEPGSGPLGVVSVTTPNGPGNIPLLLSGSGPNSSTYSATGTPSGGTYSWTPTSSKVSLSNTSSATATVTSVSASVSQNDVPITVTYTFGGQPASSTVVITVSQPTSLKVSTDTTNPTGHSCVAGSGTPSCSQSYIPGSTSYSSYLRNRAYLIQDQFSNWMSGWNMTLNESYTTPTGACASTATLQTGSGSGDTVTDCFYFCNSTCQSGGSCSVSSTQTVTVNGYSVAANSMNFTCSGVTINGN